MESEQPRTWHGLPFRGWLVVVLIVLAMAVDYAHWALVELFLLALCALLLRVALNPAIVAGQRPVPFRLRPDGLEVNTGGRWRLWRFREISQVAVRPSWLMVRAGTNVARLDDRFPAWAELRDRLLVAVPADRIEQPAEAGEVTAAQLEEWLGVPAGGELRCEPGRWGRTFATAEIGGPIALVGFGLALLGHGWLAVVGYLGLLLYTAPMLLRCDPVVASASGLRLGQEYNLRRVSWRDLHGLAADDESGNPSAPANWRLSTALGTFVLDRRLTNLEPLLEAIRNVLDASERGQVLPTPETVTEVPLVDPTEPEVERGISVVRGEGEDE